MRPQRIPRFEPFSVTAPNRVDLAGGTLDIYPLYLLLPGACTVNVAVGVSSRVELRPLRSGAALVSRDLRVRQEAPHTAAFDPSGPLGLFALALRAFPAASGVEATLANDAPLGSGLGASSALLVAFLLALRRLRGEPSPWESTANAASEIEAAHLRTLAGRQDHVASLLGGLLALTFPPGRIEAERFPAGGKGARALAARGFLAHTGKAHHSGQVNWRMVRGAVGGDRRVLSRFETIAAAARDARDALREGDADGLARAVAAEWSVRRTLARGVSPPRVERLLADPAVARHVAAAKLCGAGGGGALFGILRDPAGRGAVEEALVRHGCAPVPFRIASAPRVETLGG
jgi:D-glycero-alpha-D-manno-heptose-7-phosphate kinase